MSDGLDVDMRRGMTGDTQWKPDSRKEYLSLWGKQKSLHMRQNSDGRGQNQWQTGLEGYVPQHISGLHVNPPSLRREDFVAKSKETSTLGVQTMFLREPWAQVDQKRRNATSSWAERGGKGRWWSAITWAHQQYSGPPEDSGRVAGIHRWGVMEHHWWRSRRNTPQMVWPAQGRYHRNREQH